MEQEPKDFAEYKTDHDLLIELRTEMRGLREDFKDAKTNYVTQSEFAPVKNTYVSQTEFWPVKMLVYGCTGLMLTAIVGALLVLVIKL